MAKKNNYWSYVHKHGINLLFILTFASVNGCFDLEKKSDINNTKEQAEVDPHKPKVNATKEDLATIYFADLRREDKVLSRIKSDGTGDEVVLNFRILDFVFPAPDRKRIALKFYSEETKQKEFHIYNTETKEMLMVPNGIGEGLLQGWYDENHIMIHLRGLERREIHTGQITQMGEFIRPLQLKNKDDFIDMKKNELCFYINGKKDHCYKLPQQFDLSSVAVITKDKKKIGYFSNTDENANVEGAYIVIDTTGNLLHRFTKEQLGHPNMEVVGDQMLGPYGKWLYFLDYKTYYPYVTFCRLKVENTGKVEIITVSEKFRNSFGVFVVTY